MTTIYMPQTINYMVSLGSTEAEINALFANGEVKQTENKLQYLIIKENEQ
jgi:hypothetical protein